MDWSFPYSKLSCQFVNCKADFPSIMQRNGPFFLYLDFIFQLLSLLYTKLGLQARNKPKPSIPGRDLPMQKSGIILGKHILVLPDLYFHHHNTWLQMTKSKESQTLRRADTEDSFINVTLHLKSSYICVTAWNSYNQPYRKYHKMLLAWCKTTARRWDQNLWPYQTLYAGNIIASD